MKRILTTLMIAVALGGSILALTMESAQASVGVIVQFGPPEMPITRNPSTSATVTSGCPVIQLTTMAVISGCPAHG